MCVRAHKRDRAGARQRVTKTVISNLTSRRPHRATSGRDKDIRRQPQANCAERPQQRKLLLHSSDWASGEGWGRGSQCTEH